MLCSPVCHGIVNFPISSRFPSLEYYSSPFLGCIRIKPNCTSINCVNASPNDHSSSVVCNSFDSSLDGRSRSDIKIGSEVLVIKKEDQKTGYKTKGIVKEILTSTKYHPRGIKVRLDNGDVGRVSSILLRENEKRNSSFNSNAYSSKNDLGEASIFNLTAEVSSLDKTDSKRALATANASSSSLQNPFSKLLDLKTKMKEDESVKEVFKMPKSEKLMTKNEIPNRNLFESNSQHDSKNSFKKNMISSKKKQVGLETKETQLEDFDIVNKLLDYSTDDSESSMNASFNNDGKTKKKFVLSTVKTNNMSNQKSKRIRNKNIGIKDEGLKDGNDNDNNELVSEDVKSSKNKKDETVIRREVWVRNGKGREESEKVKENSNHSIIIKLDSKSNLNKEAWKRNSNDNIQSSNKINSNVAYCSDDDDDDNDDDGNDSDDDQSKHKISGKVILEAMKKASLERMKAGKKQKERNRKERNSSSSSSDDEDDNNDEKVFEPIVLNAEWRNQIIELKKRIADIKTMSI